MIGFKENPCGSSAAFNRVCSVQTTGLGLGTGFRGASYSKPREILLGSGFCLGSVQAMYPDNDSQSTLNLGGGGAGPGPGFHIKRRRFPSCFFAGLSSDPLQKVQLLVGQMEPPLNPKKLKSRRDGWEPS